MTDKEKKRHCVDSLRYASRHRKKVSKYHREWVSKNSDHVNEYQRTWRKNNPEKVKEYNERYKQKCKAQKESDLID